jgi:uncharacterized membrane protein YraQ (UPF0718 family)
MLFRLLRSLIVTALIGFAISVALHAQPAPQAQHSEQANTSPDEKAKHDKVAKTFREALAAILEKTWDDPVAFFTFVLAVFTGVLSISTIGLWIVTARESGISLVIPRFLSAPS